ncbi:MAG: C39 family peptidase [Candidatus Komeilibacteria bacterium]|nr:C39 family peptidase [Candidatus Komeilibacteria bacterium]
MVTTDSTKWTKWYVIGGIAVIAVVTWLAAAAKDNPDTKELAVPFTSQAPAGDWSEPWANACEETSIIMIQHFFQGRDDLNTATAKTEILKVFKEKEETAGRSLDESMETVAEIVNSSNFGWRAEIVSNPTLEEMRDHIESEKPILAPVYAPELNNPLYTAGGPDYHVIVISGYDDTEGVFIVQDPGTQSGANLKFSYDTIMEAIHDFNPDNYSAGEKKVIFAHEKLFKPNSTNN